MFRLLAICCVLGGLCGLAACSKSMEQAERVPIEKSDADTNAIDIKVRASDTGSDYVDVSGPRRSGGGSSLMPDFGPTATPADVAPSYSPPQTAHSSSHSPSLSAPRGIKVNNNVEVFPID